MFFSYWLGEITEPQWWQGTHTLTAWMKGRNGARSDVAERIFHKAESMRHSLPCFSCCWPATEKQGVVGFFYIHVFACMREFCFCMIDLCFSLLQCRRTTSHEHAQMSCGNSHTQNYRKWSVPSLPHVPLPHSILASFEIVATKRNHLRWKLAVRIWYGPQIKQNMYVWVKRGVRPFSSRLVSAAFNVLKPFTVRWPAKMW